VELKQSAVPVAEAKAKAQKDLQVELKQPALPVAEAKAKA